FFLPASGVRHVPQDRRALPGLRPIRPGGGSGLRRLDRALKDLGSIAVPLQEQLAPVAADRTDLDLRAHLHVAGGDDAQEVARVGPDQHAAVTRLHVDDGVDVTLFHGTPLLVEIESPKTLPYAGDRPPA